MCIVIINEPEVGQKILLKLNSFARSNNYIQKSIPFFADIFVFTYPLFLVVIYLYGLYQRQKNYNIGALHIFFVAVVTILINLFVQQMVCKKRPEQLVLSQQDLIFKHVPNNPFPSDHAALSAAIGFSSLFFGIKTDNKVFIYSGVIFLFISIFMSICRVAAGVHWPTDILMGWIMGLIVSLVMSYSFVYDGFYKYIYNNLYKFSLWIFKIK